MKYHFKVMCLEKDKFTQLCDLYPNSRNHIKINSLMKRRYFLQNMKQQLKHEEQGLVWEPKVYNPYGIYAFNQRWTNEELIEGFTEEEKETYY